MRLLKKFDNKLINAKPQLFKKSKFEFRKKPIIFFSKLGLNNRKSGLLNIGKSGFFPLLIFIHE